MGLVPRVPTELHELAAEADRPAGAKRYLSVLQAAAKQAGFGAPLYWAYRTLGRYLDSPVLSSIWFQAVMNGRVRGEAVARAFGPEWQNEDGFSLGLEVYRRLMAHPEGVEIARLDPATNLDDRIGFDDKKIRLAPQEIQAELSRAIHTPPAHDPDYPVIMASGLRTRWTANTIQRDPKWRKGRGPHCALNLSPGDAERLGVANGDAIRVVTKRGSVELPAIIDAKLMDGHVWMPNGFGMQYPSGEGGYDGPVEIVGVNMNDYTDIADRDPFSGCPYHRYVPCRLEAVGAAKLG